MELPPYRSTCMPHPRRQHSIWTKIKFSIKYKITWLEECSIHPHKLVLFPFPLLLSKQTLQSRCFIRISIAIDSKRRKKHIKTGDFLPTFSKIYHNPRGEFPFSISCERNQKEFFQARCIWRWPWQDSNFCCNIQLKILLSYQIYGAEASKLGFSADETVIVETTYVFQVGSSPR